MAQARLDHLSRDRCSNTAVVGGIARDWIANREIGDDGDCSEGEVCCSKQVEYLTWLLW